MASLFLQQVNNAILFPRDDGKGAIKSLPLLAAIGIVLSVTLVAFGVSGALVAICGLRKKHRRRRARTADSNIRPHAGIDSMTIPEPVQPPDIAFSPIFSSHLFSPTRDAALGQKCSDLGVHPPEQSPQVEGASSQGSSKVSPVSNSRPVALKDARTITVLTNERIMVHSPLTSHGVVIEDSTPSRSGSRASRQRCTIPVDTTRFQSPNNVKRRGSVDTTLSMSPPALPERSLGRSSAKDIPIPTVEPNELQYRPRTEVSLPKALQFILQQPEAAHRQLITRNSKRIDSFPGMPPSERLSTPPRRLIKRSCQESVKKDSIDSSRSSVLTSFIVRTPSPEIDMGIVAHELLSQPRTWTPSTRSTTTLYDQKTSNLFAPKNSESPFKVFQSGNGGNVRRVSAQNASTEGDSDGRVSTLADRTNAAAKTETSSLHALHRIPIQSDLFYSSPVAKSAIPSTQGQVLPPTSCPGTAVGKELISGPPLSFRSPLKQITGNVQSLSTKRTFSPVWLPGRENVESSLFAWSTQEVSMKKAGAMSSTRGKSRGGCSEVQSKAQRSSNRNTSSRIPKSGKLTKEDGSFERPNLEVCAPERTRQNFIWQEITTSLPTSSDWTFNGLNPTSIDFEPVVVIPDDSTTTLTVNPSIEQTDSIGTMFSKSNVSECNNHPEFSPEAGVFEQSVLNTHLAVPKRPSSMHCYLELFGRTQESQALRLIESSEKFTCSNPTTQRDKDTKSLSLPLSLSTDLSNSESTPLHSALPVTEFSSALDNSNEMSDANLHRGSLHTSINLLRRMNSDISLGSDFSVLSNEESPTFYLSSQPHSIISSLSQASTLVESKESNTEISVHDRGRSRGSKHYLSMGNKVSSSSLHSPSVVNLTKLQRLDSHHRRDREPSRHSKQPKISRKGRNVGADSKTGADDCDFILTQRNHSGRNHSLHWDFDDADFVDETMDLDVDLTSDTESVCSPKNNGLEALKRIKLSSNGNSFGVIGLQYPILDLDAQKNHIKIGGNGMGSQDLQQDLEFETIDISAGSGNSDTTIIRGSLRFKFEPLKPFFSRSLLPSSVTSETYETRPVEKERPTVLNITSSSDAMIKPTTNIARIKSTMELQLPRVWWVLSALGIPGLGVAAAARLLGNGLYRLRVVSMNRNEEATFNQGDSTT